jgi:hypothetical protein
MSATGPIKNVAVDFDGVIHGYSEGWKDGSIYDDPVEGAREAIERLSHRYNVVIFSSRADGVDSRARMVEWLLSHHITGWQTITNRKIPWEFLIDDRAFRFNRNAGWPHTLRQIEISRQEGEIE